jgi:hypothetical protein
MGTYIFLGMEEWYCKVDGENCYRYNNKETISTEIEVEADD